MIELFHAWPSFTSGRVRFCLAEKRLEWRSRAVDVDNFQNVQPDYLTVNPKGLVPTLRHDGFVLPESLIINIYLDETFPDPPLSPTDTRQRARMRLAARIADDELFPAVRPATAALVMKPNLGRFDERALRDLLCHHPRPGAAEDILAVYHRPADLSGIDRSRALLRQAFRNLEQLMGDDPWLAGVEFSLADIAAAPVLPRLDRLGLTDLLEEYPRLLRWAHRLRNRPAFTGAFATPG